MNDGKITSLNAIGSIDRTTDVLEIVDVSANASFKVTVNNLVGISGGDVLSTSDAQDVGNKTLDNTNALTIKASNFTIQDDTDTSKQAQFIASGITTGTLRSYTLPNASDTLAGLTATQVFTNKTLTNPILTLPTIANFSLAQHDHSSAAQGGVIAATGSGLALEINGVPNGDQALLNLVSGDGVTLTDDLSGNITIDASGGGGGGNVVLQKFMMEDGDVHTGSTLIPYDDTVPQSTEGDALGSFSIEITGTDDTASAVFQANILVSSSATTDVIIASIFDGTGSDATAATAVTTSAAGQMVSIAFGGNINLGNTTTKTFTLRVGSSNSGTITMNGAGGSRKLGSTMFNKSIFTVSEEIVTST